MPAAAAPPLRSAHITGIYATNINNKIKKITKSV